jgi:hypothetical protein
MDSSASITIDDSHWPLLVMTFVGEPTLQQQEAHLARVSTYLRRDEQFVSILDTRRERMMTAEHRRRLAEFLKEHDALLRTQVLGCASVITSPIMQLAASIVLHLKPLPFPYFTTRSLPEAGLWAATRLEGTGLLHLAERIRRHYGPRAESCIG